MVCVTNDIQIHLNTNIITYIIVRYSYTNMYISKILLYKYVYKYDYLYNWMYTIIIFKSQSIDR